MRINARLEENDVVKLEALKSHDQLTTTQVIKKAIDLMYQHTMAHPQGSIHALLESNFVGCAKGPEDGSVNYKQQVAEYLDEKHPDR